MFPRVCSQSSNRHSNPCPKDMLTTGPVRWFRAVTSDKVKRVLHCGVKTLQALAKRVGFERATVRRNHPPHHWKALIGDNNRCHLP
jgi:hypothetical protein